MASSNTAATHFSPNSLLQLSAMTGLILALWTKQELAAIAFVVNPKASNVGMDRYQHLGGVPRIVFEDIRAEPIKLLLVACRQCSLSDCIRTVSIRSETTGTTSTLIHVHSPLDYDSLTKKSPQSIEQYTIRIVYPESVVNVDAKYKL